MLIYYINKMFNDDWAYADYQDLNSAHIQSVRYLDRSLIQIYVYQITPVLWYGNCYCKHYIGNEINLLYLLMK